ncbi:MAG: hypothetical protein M3340_19545 [Actinomycetota bacterium]|nr:hypothetical protein [Actinomycetota bacterium]
MDRYRDDPALVLAHVNALGLRSPSEAMALLESLHARCWPGGADDRLDRVAVEWVRRWAPSTLAAARVTCSCADGRCAVCN